MFNFRRVTDAVFPGRWLSRVVLLLAVLAGAYLRLHGLTERGMFNSDFVAYVQEAAYLDKLSAWRRDTGVQRKATFAEQNQGKRDATPPGHAKPMHIELHRIGNLFAGDYFLGISLMGAIMGTLNIWLLYILAKKITGSELTALLSAVLLAVSGYNVMYAGRSYNHADGTFFALLGAVALAWYWGQPRFGILPYVFGLGFGLSVSCHYNVVVMLPLVLFFSFVAAPTWGRRFLAAVLAFLGIVSVIVVFQMYYMWLHSVSSEVKTYVDQFFQNQMAGTDGVSWDFRHLPDYAMYNLTLDGWGLFLSGVLGLGLFVVRNLRALILVRWTSVGPALYLAAIVAFSFLIWGSYSYKVPRTQIFTSYVWPFFAAYLVAALFRFEKFAGSDASSKPAKAGVGEGQRAEKASRWPLILANSIAVSVLVIIVAESWSRSLHLAYLGKGHRMYAEWIKSTQRSPVSGVAILQERLDPLGRSGVWYIDSAEVISSGKADSLAIDYPSFFHNVIYNQATHPGSVQFGMRFFAVLDAEHVPIYQAEYVEPLICQFENGRIWHLKFSAEQPLSKYIRVYDGKDVLTAYQKVMQRYYQQK